jgi:hypothetical protein
MSAACQYETDVTDAQWEILHPLLPTPTWTPGSRGRPPRPLRRVVNGLAAALKPKPTVRVPRGESTRRSTLSREEASSGKILMKDHVFSMRCKFCPLSPKRSFRESCRAQLSRSGVKQHRRSQLH